MMSLCFLLMLVNCKTFSPFIFYFLFQFILFYFISFIYLFILKIQFLRIGAVIFIYSKIVCNFAKTFHRHAIVSRSLSLVIYPCRWNLICFAERLEYTVSKQNPNRHIGKGLFTMPINKSFKISFFKLVVFSLTVVFLKSSFILIHKSPSIMYFINHLKHLGRY